MILCSETEEQSKTASTTNSCASMILAILALVFAVMIFNHSQTFTQKSEKTLGTAVQMYDQSTRLGKAMIDEVQMHLRCCGVHDKEEWLNSTHAKYPVSCCDDFLLKNCSKIFDRPCLPEIEQRFTNRLYAIGIMGIILGGFEVLAFVTACFILTSSISRAKAATLNV